MGARIRGKLPVIPVLLCILVALVYLVWDVVWPVESSLRKRWHSMDLVCNNTASSESSYKRKQGTYCRERALMDIASDRDKQQYRSQYGQDRWLEKNVLEFLPYNPKTFVEFGARDGSEHSNTYKWDKEDGDRGIPVSWFNPLSDH